MELTSRSSIASSSNSESTDESEDVKENSVSIGKVTPPPPPVGTSKENMSEPFQPGLFLYVDLHGHASKKGRPCYSLNYRKPGITGKSGVLREFHLPRKNLELCKKLEIFAGKNVFLENIVRVQEPLEIRGGSRTVLAKHCEIKTILRNYCGSKMAFEKHRVGYG